MRKTILLLVLGCFSCVPLRAQVESVARTMPTGASAFFVEALSFRSHDSAASRIDVYVQVPYENLKFVTDTSGFVARYEVTVDVLNAQGGEVFEKSWDEDVHTKSFDETQSRKEYSLTQRSLSLAPGAYTLRTQMNELESGRRLAREEKMEVGNYANSPFALSDIMLVSHATNEAGHTSIVPNVSGNLYDLTRGFFVFLEAYNASPADSVQLTYNIFSKKAVALYSRTERRRLDGPTTQIVARVDSAQLPLGAYDFEVEARTIPRSPVGPTFTAQRDRGFVMRWAYVPVTMTDLDLAIRQAKYLATESEYDSLTATTSLEEKQKRFIAFWQKRNAGSDAQHNDYMEQYYSRVQYANEHFAHYIDGWRTDMGMVFILLGPPNNVDRHPFDEDSKPYEIWSYYDYNARVVFVDRTGFGDYKLVTPIWDLVRRLR